MRQARKLFAPIRHGHVFNLAACRREWSIARRWKIPGGGERRRGVKGLQRILYETQISREVEIEPAKPVEPEFRFRSCFQRNYRRKCRRNRRNRFPEHACTISRTFGTSSPRVDVLTFIFIETREREIRSNCRAWNRIKLNSIWIWRFTVFNKSFPDETRRRSFVKISICSFREFKRGIWYFLSLFVQFSLIRNLISIFSLPVHWFQFSVSNLLNINFK